MGFLFTAGLIEKIADELSVKAIGEMIQKTVIDLLVETVATKVAAQIALILAAPVGGALKGVQMIYSAVKWLINNISRIQQLVETVIGGLEMVIAKDMEGIANNVESALAETLPLAIGFFASLAGLGDLPQKVQKAIASLREVIQKKIEKVVDWVVEKAKKSSGKKKGPKKETNEEDASKASSKVVQPLKMIGSIIKFQSAEENHKLWIETKGKNATVMVASPSESVEKMLGKAEIKIEKLPDETQVQVKPFISSARKKLKGLDSDADNLTKKNEGLKTSASSKSQGSSGAHSSEGASSSKDIKKANTDVIKDEKILADILKEIFDIIGEENAISKYAAGPAPTGWEQKKVGSIQSIKVNTDDPGHHYHLLDDKKVVITTEPHLTEDSNTINQTAEAIIGKQKLPDTIKVTSKHELHFKKLESGSIEVRFDNTKFEDQVEEWNEQIKEWGDTKGNLSDTKGELWLEAAGNAEDLLHDKMGNFKAVLDAWYLNPSQEKINFDKSKNEIVPMIQSILEFKYQTAENKLPDAVDVISGYQLHFEKLESGGVEVMLGHKSLETQIDEWKEEPGSDALNREIAIHFGVMEKVGPLLNKMGNFKAALHGCYKSPFKGRVKFDASKDEIVPLIKDILEFKSQADKFAKLPETISLIQGHKLSFKALKPEGIDAMFDSTSLEAQIKQWDNDSVNIFKDDDLWLEVALIREKLLGTVVDFKEVFNAWEQKPSDRERELNASKDDIVSLIESILTSISQAADSADGAAENKLPEAIKVNSEYKLWFEQLKHEGVEVMFGQTSLEAQINEWKQESLVTEQMGPLLNEIKILKEILNKWCQNPSQEMTGFNRSKNNIIELIKGILKLAPQTDDFSSIPKIFKAELLLTDPDARDQLKVLLMQHSKKSKRWNTAINNIKAANPDLFSHPLSAGKFGKKALEKEAIPTFEKAREEKRKELEIHCPQKLEEASGDVNKYWISDIHKKNFPYEGVVNSLHDQIILEVKRPKAEQALFKGFLGHFQGLIDKDKENKDNSKKQKESLQALLVSMKEHYKDVAEEYIKEHGSGSVTYKWEPQEICSKESPEREKILLTLGDIENRKKTDIDKIKPILLNRHSKLFLGLVKQLAEELNKLVDPGLDDHQKIKVTLKANDYPSLEFKANTDHHPVYDGLTGSNIVSFLTTLGQKGSVSRNGHTVSYEEFVAVVEETAYGKKSFWYRVSDKNTNKEHIKNKYREITDGQHEWLQCQHLNQLITRARNAEKASELIDAAEWINFSIMFRTPTTELIFDPTAVIPAPDNKKWQGMCTLFSKRLVSLTAIAQEVINDTSISDVAFRKAITSKIENLPDQPDGKKFPTDASFLELRGHAGALYINKKPLITAQNDWHDYAQKKVFGDFNSNVDQNTLITRALQMVKDTIWDGSIEGFESDVMKSVLSEIDSPYRTLKGVALPILSDLNGKEIDLSKKSSIESFVKSLEGEDLDDTKELQESAQEALDKIIARYQNISLSIADGDVQFPVKSLLDLMERQAIQKMKLISRLNKMRK